MDELYTLENAEKFKWSSVSGNLNAERVAHLEKYLTGEKILDAGCGGGAYVEFLSAKGFQATGIDKFDKFLGATTQQRQLGSYVRGDLTNLPFRDGAFDCTYCFDVLEHIDDKLAVKELARVTKKRLIIAVPRDDDAMSAFNLTFLHYQDKTHLRNYTEDYLKNLFAEIGCFDAKIFPELAVPAEHLVREMIEFSPSAAAGLKRIYHKTRRRLLSKMLAQTQYKQIFTGLVAVVDLAGNGKL